MPHTGSFFRDSAGGTALPRGLDGSDVSFDAFVNSENAFESTPTIDRITLIASTIPIR